MSKPKRRKLNLAKGLGCHQLLDRYANRHNVRVLRIRGLTVDTLQEAYAMIDEFLADATESDWPVFHLRASVKTDLAMAMQLPRDL